MPLDRVELLPLVREGVGAVPNAADEAGSHRPREVVVLQAGRKRVSPQEEPVPVTQSLQVFGHVRTVDPERAVVSPELRAR